MRDCFVRWRALALLALLPLGGCDDLFGPDARVVEDGELTIIPVDPQAPPLTSLDVSFWAVKGEDREVQIRYEYGNGNGKCLRFVVPANALHRDVQGRRIEEGDSVRIRIQVVDPKLFLFVFDPRGIRFHPDHPARLEVRYRWASADLDGDGTPNDPDDLEIRSRFGLWKQERAGSSWQEIASTRDEPQSELHADVDGFTRYALAAD